MTTISITIINLVFNFHIKHVIIIKREVYVDFGWSRRVAHPIIRHVSHRFHHFGIVCRNYSETEIISMWILLLPLHGMRGWVPPIWSLLVSNSQTYHHVKKVKKKKKIIFVLKRVLLDSNRRPLDLPSNTATHQVLLLGWVTRLTPWLELPHIFYHLLGTK